MAKYANYSNGSETSICINCAMTTKGCPWAQKRIPLLDWEAVPIKKMVSLGGVRFSSDSKSRGTWCLSQRHPAPL